eukprot:TRINITY_DN2298_c0_g1_i2.p1 TRINITY_DN2298_c0_g1~~TRINITY_DN2298_c0_g1_i2.p1  ORF type:complete len:276 (-),score=54.34 TRINITY_DN2298_c0_g1_i2:31-858(-)
MFRQVVKLNIVPSKPFVRKASPFENANFFKCFPLGSFFQQNRSFHRSVSALEQGTQSKELTSTSLFQEVFEEEEVKAKEKRREKKEKTKKGEVLEPTLAKTEAVVHRRRIRIPFKKLLPFGRFLKGQSVDKAIKQLQVNPKRIARILVKTLQQLKNNAKVIGLNQDNIVVDRVICNKGVYQLRRIYHSKGRFGLRSIYQTHCSIWGRESVPEDFYGSRYKRLRINKKLREKEKIDQLYARFEKEKRQEEAKIKKKMSKLAYREKMNQAKTAQNPA